MSKNKKEQTNASIPYEYTPIAYELPEIKDDIFDYKIDPQFSSNSDYPKFSFGFHHYYHQSKNKMIITEKFEGKKKVYNIMHPFEIHIDDYEDDISNTSISYFGLKNKSDIINNNFCGLWEMILMFDLIPTNKSGFISTHLGKNRSFVQAIKFYRNMFSKKNVSKKDKYDIIKNFNSGKIKNSASKNKNLLFKPSKTSLSRTWLVTAEGGSWINESTQEPEVFNLILGEVITALKIQAKNGNFICKIFESFTQTTVKLICVLLSFYKNVQIVKPNMSYDSDSEKYLVCIGYKGPNNKKIKMLENMLELSYKKKSKHIVDFFPEFKILHDIIAAVTEININVANRQFVRINEIVDFIKKESYRGEEYHNQREIQIEATKYWLDRFFFDSKKYINKKKQIMDSIKVLIKKNNKSIHKMDEIIE
uniref:FtsJ-like methyltransferase n=1 Tax=Mimivirus LCMiAC01 TaxID=2506608 RepID=A0A481YZZ8_9VIRU|nr:MAG: FtsJ-like methyltransferase [Mimivirus LCMiAC01]